MLMFDRDFDGFFFSQKRDFYKSDMDDASDAPVQAELSRQVVIEAENDLEELLAK